MQWSVLTASLRTWLSTNARWVAGGLTGGLFGFVFGSLAAVAAARGDSTFKSGMHPAAVFALTIAGWSASGMLGSGLSAYAHNRSAANWVGLATAVPITITSLLVVTTKAEFFSLNAAAVFIVCDAFFGLVGAEVMWREYHKPPEEDGD